MNICVPGELVFKNLHVFVSVAYMYLWPSPITTLCYDNNRSQVSLSLHLFVQTLYIVLNINRLAFLSTLSNHITMTIVSHLKLSSRATVTIYISSDFIGK